MIHQYKDHAANERTYLAWIRTAIAVMAFGFLVEKFDLFISYISHAMGTTIRFKASLSFEYIGLGFILIAIFILVGSSLRFYRTGKAIESDLERHVHTQWPAIALACVMVSLALFLLVYMVNQVVGM